MVLSVYVYGSGVLKKTAASVTEDYPRLQQLISDMWDTLYNAGGVGLAAPQVGHAIRLIVIDASSFKDDDPLADGFKRVLINPELMEFSEEKVSFNEGCLSIPGVHEDVVRPKRVRVHYFDEHFQEHNEWFDATPARIAQHEYDHIEGVLFTERLAPIRRKIISRKLQNISRGKGEAGYKTRIN
ncbi:MAG: peptide deformylase [Prevotellaceae bacterium]|jgi:peptide deformylase|nr:peptide deformylase [Prevotellaceae bacterium]